jgi:hypothetical protein
MTRGRARVHLDATKTGDAVRRAACGWLAVDTEVDPSLVTCKECPGKLGKKRALTARELLTEIFDAAHLQLVPKAGPPPRVNAPIWAASCKGAEHRRCGDCEICVWERDAQRWAAVSPWNREHALQRPENSPRWPSLAAALVALVEFDRHDRHGPSPMGGIIRRLERGAPDDGGRSRPDDPMLHRAGELVRVRQALELAYPDGGHATLAANICRALLLVRTPGVLVDLPTYEVLAVELAATVGELKALVKSGRRVVGAELEQRGLIPRERLRRRSVEAAISVMAPSEDA